MYSLLFSLGIIVRFLLIGAAGFKADMAFWKGWGLAAADKGVIWLVKNTNYNYPPGFAYILSLINHIYKLFADPYNVKQYWLDNNYLYLFLFKLIIIVSDIGIALLIIKIAKKYKQDWWGKVLAIVYLLSPAVIFDGVIWGQVDQFGLLLFLLTIYFLIEEKLNWAAVFFTLSWLLKMQNIVFIPIFYLFIFKKYSFEKLVKSIAISLAIFALVILPFWLNREMASIINLFIINSNWFPWYSLNAFNVWWLAAGLDGMKISDKTLVLGIINAKQLGLIFFSFFYFLASLNIFLVKKEESFKAFILSSVLVVFSFFHLLTQSHERYLFPLLGLIPLMFLINSAKKTKQFIILFILTSFGIFLNMYYSMVTNYPDQVYWPFSNEFTRSFSFYLSIIQIGTFIYFLVSHFNYFVKKNYLIVLGTISVILLFIFFKNLNYFLSGPILLTKLNSINAQQDYLPPVNNMTVESYRGVKYWNRLSTNYYFYREGIGGHANSTISYGIGGRFSTFKSDYGLDTEAGDQAKALFVVLGDGREIYRSKIRGKYDPPESISVDIKNVQIFTLKIEAVGGSNSGAHADWLKPELIR